jgi:hypothetical protein
VCAFDVQFLHNSAEVWFRNSLPPSVWIIDGHPYLHIWFSKYQVSHCFSFLVRYWKNVCVNASVVVKMFLFPISEVFQIPNRSMWMRWLRELHWGIVCRGVSFGNFLFLVVWHLRHSWMCFRMSCPYLNKISTPTSPRISKSNATTLKPTTRHDVLQKISERQP